MKRFALVPLLLGAALAGCMTPVGPVEVTRFHQPEAVDSLAMGTIAVEAAPGQDPESLELRTYQEAVAQELQRIGYTRIGNGESDQVAEVRYSRRSYRPGRSGSGVSVGVGGHTGSFGSGVGLGLGIDLSGAPKEQVLTELGVMIKDRASGETIWEGRASFAAPIGSPLAETQLGAAKMAAAMFQDFPGNNGETITVK
jgi:hypothetical protein